MSYDGLFQLGMGSGSLKASQTEDLYRIRTARPVPPGLRRAQSPSA